MIRLNQFCLWGLGVNIWNELSQIHYKINYICAGVCWICLSELMSGNLSSDRSQDTLEACRAKGLLFGEQRSIIVGKICLSEYVLIVCDDGWRNCLIAVLQPTALHLCYTHLWAYTIHPPLRYGKGYNTTVGLLYFVMYKEIHVVRQLSLYSGFHVSESHACSSQQAAAFYNCYSQCNRHNQLY